MPTLNKLEYLDETKSQIKTALNQFGAGIQDTDTFRSYVSKISNIYTNWAKVTGENTLLSLTPTKKGLMELNLKGNTSQASTPTPDTPQPIHSVSGDNKIMITGKNLLNPQFFQQGSIDVTTGQDVSNSKNARGSNYIPVLPNTTYTISANTSLNQLRISEYGSDKTHIRRSASTNNVSSFTITTTSETYFVRWSLNYDNATNTSQELIDSLNLQLEKGSLTSYEPFGDTYPINLPSGMELNSIGDYKDTFKYENDKWYLEKKIGKLVLDGTKTWTNPSNTSYSETILRFRCNDYTDVLYTGSQALILSDYFEGVPLATRTQNGIARQLDSSGINVFIDNSIVSDLATFKTWLGNHNVNVYYPLSTPQDIEITDTTLISQLNAIRNAMSKQGQTNISQVNNDKPFIISASALMKGGN